MNRGGFRVFIGVLFCLAAFAVVRVCLSLRPKTEEELFWLELEETTELLERWRFALPDGVTDDQWENAFISLMTAYGNAWSFADIQLDALRRFRADIEEKLKEPASVEGLKWIYNRIAETGPRGRAFTARFGGNFFRILEEGE